MTESSELFLSQVNRHKSRLQEISTRATSEAMLEQTLARLSDLWQMTDLRLVPHSNSSVCIISSADELFTQLEESQVTIGTIRGSRYVAPIKVRSFATLSQVDHLINAKSFN